MSEHAFLSPSASDRWLECPASVRMEEKIGKGNDKGSVYAQEGTDAHTLCEVFVRSTMLDTGSEEIKGELARTVSWIREKYGEDVTKEMLTHAAGYAQFLSVRMRHHPVRTLLLEQRLKTPIPRCWGTSDAVIVSLKEIEIVDLKYGAGIPVSALSNSQLMLYALGALEAFDGLLGTLETVTMSIYQPRITADPNRITTWSLSAGELRAWGERARVVAEEALGDDAHFSPGEKTCRWCPASGRCDAQAQYMFEQAGVEFGSDPDLLTPGQMADILGVASQIRSWLSDIESQALRLAYSGDEEIPGYKVVMKGSRRYMADPAAAIQTFIDSGYPAEQVADFKVKTFGHLEKLVGGRARFDELVGKFIGQTNPGPGLVLASAPGQAVTARDAVEMEFGDAVPED